MTALSALLTQCAQRFTDPSNDIIAATGGAGTRNWLDYLNRSYRDVLTASPIWPWNESSEQQVTVLANTRGISLPTGTYQVNWVYDVTNDRRVIPDEGRGSMYRGGYQLRSTTIQIPETYKMRNNQVELYPMPSSDVTLAMECVIYPSDLTTGASTTVLPPAFDQMIVDGALSYAYLDDGNVPQYSANLANFTARLKDLKLAMLSFRDETFPPVRDQFWN